MFKWFKNIIQKYTNKLLQKYLDNLYTYTIRNIILSLMTLYDNTWDKERVKALILKLQSINLEAYIKDEELHKLILEKFKYK
jgi:hypothetical protein